MHENVMCGFWNFLRIDELLFYRFSYRNVEGRRQIRALAIHIGWKIPGL